MVSFGHQSAATAVGSFKAELLDEANQRFHRFAAPLLKEVRQ